MKVAARIHVRPNDVDECNLSFVEKKNIYFFPLYSVLRKMYSTTHHMNPYPADKI